MFEDKLELAYAVIDGVQAREKNGNYSTQRVKFYSNAPAYFLLHSFKFPHRLT